MPSEVEHQDGRVISVSDAEIVTDPTSEEAVQIPDTPTVNASAEDSFSVHDEPTPEEIFADPDLAEQFAVESTAGEVVDDGSDPDDAGEPSY